MSVNPSTPPLGDPLFLLQELQFPPTKLALELYLRLVGGNVEASAQSAAFEKGAKVSLNTWCNSFFEQFWLEQSIIEDLFLELDLEGTALIEVFRDTPDSGVHRIEWQKVRTLWPSSVTIPISLARPGGWGGAGRIFVDISAETALTFTGGRFKTSSPPRQTPVVSLQIVPASDLEGTKAEPEELVARLRGLPEINKFTVLQPVSGSDASAEARSVASQTHAAAASRDTAITDQPDAGAAQGASSVLTHEIRVESRTVFEAVALSNILRFLAYAPPETALTTSTLELKHPWQRWSTRGSSNAQEVQDLRSLDALSLAEERPQADSVACWLGVRGGGSVADLPDPKIDLSIGNLVTKSGDPLFFPGAAVWHAACPETDIFLFNDPLFMGGVQMDLQVLQEVLLTDDMVVADLYVRLSSGETELAGDRIICPPGSKLSFNTYFNSFYESYWTECAPFGDLVLEVNIKGRGLVEVFRDTQSGGCQRIQSRKMHGTLGAWLPVPVIKSGTLGDRGRLFIDFTAESDCTLLGLRFSTNRQPRTKATFTVGICTFNREPWLLRNLQSIVQGHQAYTGLKQIIVVNQGPKFRDQELAELVDGSPLISLIEQRNLGGCGGFTRTMHESLHRHEVSHHVLMDDDTSLDARVLGNLNRFLNYASPDVIVGGHMLDSLRPCVLYEGGAMVRANSRIKALHHNLDLRPADALIPFNRCHYADYNAWWFCAIPTHHMRAARYPAPIFIRGDDVEYGLRLGERGVKTVALPGIAIWHEPFYAKVGGWQLYYDLRNRLILAAAYPHRCKLESPRNVLWGILRCLALHDYLGAALLTKAVQDFLGGPALMDTDSEEIHRQVAQLARELPAESVAEITGLKTPAIRPEPKGPARITASLVRQFFRVLLGGQFAKSPMLLMDSQAHLGNVRAGAYVKTNGAGTYRLLYQPSPRLLRQGLTAARSVYARYKKSRANAAAQWAERLPSLRQEARWEAIFNGQSQGQER
jgi:galactofuranosylgalactofuranosylrhamnosyl-N-acetylglucosaminyl-diphospho-decaprenol beta-1,5/1,6-galactofuranosyltransferase